MSILTAKYYLSNCDNIEIELMESFLIGFFLLTMVNSLKIAKFSVHKPIICITFSYYLIRTQENELNFI